MAFYRKKDNQEINFRIVSRRVSMWVAIKGTCNSEYRETDGRNVYRITS